MSWADAQTRSGNYPQRTVQIFALVPMGSPSDRLAREIATRLRAKLGTAFIVINRPAPDAVARTLSAEPDGHTLLVSADDATREFPQLTSLGGGVFAPKGMSPELAQFLRAEIAAVTGAPAAQLPTQLAAKTEVTAQAPSLPTVVSSTANRRFPSECAAATGRDSPGMGMEVYAQVTRLERQGLVDQAYAELVRQFCAMSSASGKSPVASRAATNRRQVADYEAAAWFLQRAVEYEGAMRVLGPGSRLQLAAMYARVGDRDSALSMLGTLARVSLGPRDPNYVGELLQQAEVHAILGDADRSFALLRTVDEILPNPPSDKRARTAIGGGLYFASMVAMALIEGGHVDAAKRVAQWLIEKQSIWPFGMVVDRVGMHRTFAQVALSQGDQDGALRHARGFAEENEVWRKAWQASALTSQQSRFPAIAAMAAEYRALAETPDYLMRAEEAWLSGAASLLSGQTKVGVDRLMDAVRTIESLRGLVEPENRVSFFAENTGPYAWLVDGLVALDAPANNIAGLDGLGRTTGEAAFYFLEATRARNLGERLALSSMAGSSLPAEVATRERELAGRTRAELNSGVPFGDSVSYREMQQFVEKLRSEHPAYAASRYPQPVRASAVPLQPREVLLSYAILRDRVAIWVLRRGEPVRVLTVRAARADVMESIAAFRQSLEPREGNLQVVNRAASQRLYQWLLSEPMKLVAKGASILIVPDSALAAVPFEALSESAADGATTLADRGHAIAYAPSATVLAHVRRPGASKASRGLAGTLYALGDPVFAADDARAAANSLAAPVLESRARALRSFAASRQIDPFARLPGTAREISAIAAHFRTTSDGTSIRVGLDANERDLKRHDLSAYRYLHFATHGVLAEDVPYLKTSALVLSQVGDLGGEDGFLSADEILGLNLQSDLVVLSACQTALGKEVSGEGAVSLARAFLYAGSRSVVVSLWKVDDAATALLMERFYGLIAKGMGLRAALAGAKDALRNDAGGRYGHPFFWAPFVLFGTT